MLANRGYFGKLKHRAVGHYREEILVACNYVTKYMKSG